MEILCLSAIFSDGAFCATGDEWISKVMEAILGVNICQMLVQQAHAEVCLHTIYTFANNQYRRVYMRRDAGVGHSRGARTQQM